MSSKDAVKEGSDSKSNDTTNLTSSRVKSSRKKKLKKFDFITEDGDHVYLTKEQIKEQKRIEEYVKAEAAKHEVKITNCDVLTRKGPITQKVYREDGTSEVIINFKACDLHLGEWRKVVKACLNKKGKGWSTIYEQIQTRIDYLHHTEEELGIDLENLYVNRTLSTC
ncbi:hypothetical protein Tco_1128819 [Tanacetum coccineum]